MAHASDSRDSYCLCLCQPCVLVLLTVSALHRICLDRDGCVLLNRRGNYDHIFATRACGNVVDYYLSDPNDGYRFSVAELQQKLQQRESNKPALLVLNIPSNPSGYAPTMAECQQLVQLISEQPGPLVIVLDEAYKDMVWHPDLLPSESLI